MNLIESEEPLSISARTCGCREKNGKRVAYTFIDSYHGLCLDKKDIVMSELGACTMLLRYSTDPEDRLTLEKEITQLKMMLDLLEDFLSKVN
jgi:hypothetical protein